MKYLFVILALGGLLLACEGNTAARKAARGTSFVPAPNRIFFRNTRLRHYAADERRAEVTVYRHDDLYAGSAVVLPTIVDYWQEDRATVRFEIRRGEDAPRPLPFRIVTPGDTAREAVTLATPPTPAEIAQLRQLIGGRQLLQVVIAQDTLPLFPGAVRPAAREVLDDYLRLVGYTE